MTDALRKRFATRFRQLLDAGLHRKAAMLVVREEIRELNPQLPNSRTQIYVWCRKFGVSTR